MRLSLLLASSVLAASVALAGCSTTGGSSQAIPGGGSATAMSHHGSPQILALGAKGFKGGGSSCPSQYYECIEIPQSSSATQEWCIVYSGTSDCTDLYPGTWTWTGDNISAKKGKHTKKISSSFSPNPGNPTTLTISVPDKTKATKGKVKYVVELEVCNSASSCLGPVPIGVSVEPAT